MQVLVVAPRGFCAGVARAIAAVESVLATYGPPVYVRRQIVHNAEVISRLSARGARFVDEIDQVPAGAPVVLSAHGSPQWVQEAAPLGGRIVFDAVCPLVDKVHREVRRFLVHGYSVILIGHAGHDEVEGTLGQAAPGEILLVESIDDVSRVRVANAGRVACVSQTTLNPDDVASITRALRARFPGLVVPRTEDVCYASRNRQDAVRWLAGHADLVLVFGSANSSNARRLVEVARAGGAPAQRLDRIGQLDPAWLDRAQTVGITAGASTPEFVVAEAVEWFRLRGAVIREETRAVESLWFAPLGRSPLVLA